MQRIEWGDQAAMLLDGRIDVGHVRLPIDEAGLRVAPLYAEPRVAVLPAGHRLARKDQVTEADLAGEPLVWHADQSTQPTGRPHPDAGYVARGVDETLEHVAAGRGISFLARSATVFYSRPDVVYAPVSDLAPDQVSLAVVRHRASRGWSTTSSPRSRRRPRSRQNVGTTKCGSVDSMPPQSTVEQFD